VCSMLKYSVLIVVERYIKCNLGILAVLPFYIKLSRFWKINDSTEVYVSVVSEDLFRGSSVLKVQIIVLCH
jgi:hypothetical protein